MNLENSIKDVITAKLEDGTIEKLVGEQLEKGINSALESMFGSYGDATKVIKEKIKSVMIPYLEAYDYSKYITKLDGVLVEILQNTSIDNKKMLENFKDLMLPEDRKTIKVSEIFKAWKEHVSEHVDTSDLEINYDDDISYEYVEVTMEFERDDSSSWSSFEYGTLIFECEADEEMNMEIKLSKYEKDNEWRMDYKNIHSISSLRMLNKLEVFLMRLDQVGTKIEMDTEEDSDDIEVDAVPEASFS